MKLIAITQPQFFHGEARLIEQMLDSGLYWRVHLRKPEAAEADVKKLVMEIPQRLWPRLTIHYFPELAQSLGLGGIHLNSRLKEPPEGWTGLVSRSCHSLDELVLPADYSFLSPVFDSISKPGYMSRFSPDQLRGKVGSTTFALGGVTQQKLPLLEKLGFGGAAMLGAVWPAPNIETASKPEAKSGTVASGTAGQETETKPQINKIHNNMMLQYITDRAEGLEEVLRGGCRWIQLRMKDAPDKEFITTGRTVGALCRSYGATFILDDRVDLVRPLEADGVHLGLQDMPLDEARRQLGSGKIIGATANTSDHVKRAIDGGADYLGIGPYRFTTTKKNLAPILGLEGYRRIMAHGLPVPVVAIGGIELDDLLPLRATGVTGVAVSGLIMRSDNPQETTRKIIEIWKN